MPNRAIEFHDSTVDSIQTNGPPVVLHFPSAYVHKSAGEPGWDAGSGWVQEARLLIADGVIEGALGELPCDLWHGELHLDGKLFQLIPIPIAYRGDVQIDLEFMGNMRISGTSISLELIGKATYVEEFSGHTRG